MKQSLIFDLLEAFDQIEMGDKSYFFLSEKPYFPSCERNIISDTMSPNKSKFHKSILHLYIQSLQFITQLTCSDTKPISKHTTISLPECLRIENWCGICSLSMSKDYIRKILKYNGYKQNSSLLCCKLLFCCHII